MKSNFSFFTEQNNTLIGEFKFKNFTQAFAFLAQMAILQEKHNHHAKIENMYNRVTLTLTTHDAGYTVTDKDYNLAKEIEGLLHG